MLKIGRDAVRRIGVDLSIFQPPSLPNVRRSRPSLALGSGTNDALLHQCALLCCAVAQTAEHFSGVLPN
jgi:hypothetical protein